MQQRDSKPGIKWRGMITTFGGLIKKEEKPIDAAIREIKEELSLRLGKEDLVFFRKYSRKGLKEDKIGYIYVASNIESDKLKLKEGKGIIFLEPDKIDNPNIPIVFLKIIRDFMKWKINSCGRRNKIKKCHGKYI